MDESKEKNKIANSRNSISVLRSSGAQPGYSWGRAWQCSTFLVAKGVVRPFGERGMMVDGGGYWHGE